MDRQGGFPAPSGDDQRRSDAIAESRILARNDGRRGIEPDGGSMIEVEGLTKRYGDKLAVDDLSFTARTGRVTGLLGPNGAGKSTTMRMILGLHRPSSGTVRIDGRSFVDEPAPLAMVGMLDAHAVHPGRTARNFLEALAATHHLPARRVDEVLKLTGMTGPSVRRVGTYSLGMVQRLGIAAALLGSPGTLVLDEPVNGLDPDGVHWVRSWCAASRRTAPPCCCPATS